MPEKLVSLWAQISDALLFFAIGILIGFGQAKSRREKDFEVIVGRSICVGGLAMAAGTVLIWVPQLSMVGQCGVAAGLASLGTSGLERMLIKAIELRAAK